MPLKEGSSKEIVGENISELISSGYPRAQAIAIAMQKAGLSKDAYADMFDTSRTEDLNGFIEIEDNPISKVGVFPYSGKAIGDKENPDKIYMVYRPESELSSQDCIDSFKLSPIIIDHTMLGEGHTAPEDKGIDGVVGEKVYFKDGKLFGNLKLFTNRVKDVIDSVRKEVSLGFRCAYEFSSGVFDGVHYDVIQRSIRGNHLALVGQGRMGPDIAVLDHFAIDAKEIFDMAQQAQKKQLKDSIKNLQTALGLDEGEEKKEEAKASDEEGEGMTLEKLHEIVKGIVSTLAEMKGASDQEEEKKTEDQEEEKKDEEPKASDQEEKKEGMDAAEVSRLIESKQRELVKSIQEKGAFADRCSRLVGAFDHSEMVTTEEVAAYAAGKLGIKVEKGQAKAAVEGYLAATKPQPVFAIASDSAQPSVVDAYLSGK